jgi:predicted HAD superfamily Cof-like phosphohydrolase
VNVADLLNEWHEGLDQPFGQATAEARRLRRDLHEEEGKELLDALDSGDVVAIARELADEVYTAYSTAHLFGIPLDAVIYEVHNANMRKLTRDGVRLREDGKVLKPEGWRPPDVALVLADARRREEARRA